MPNFVKPWFFICLTTLAPGVISCSTSDISPGPTKGTETKTLQLLLKIPEPEQKVVVALYGFPDQTGQYQPSQNIASYSRAVTQGGASVVVKALHDAGRGKWFTIVEREGLQQLMTERQIIRETRSQYRDGQGKQLPPPPPLLYAGVMLQGGIIGYDSNTKTGGIGARAFGLGANTQYQQDTVTVMLRAVSTQSGEVLASVTTQKTIISVSLATNVFRYIDPTQLLEIDAGLTANEPGLIALQQAIELAVYSLIMEGASAGIWRFKDKAAGAETFKEYGQHE